MKIKIKNILNDLSQYGYLSISRIQRFFRVGYTRALKFVKKMEELKVVAAYKDGKAEIIDKEKFIDEGVKEIYNNWNLNNFSDYDIINNNFLNFKTAFSSAMEFLSIDLFANRVDSVLGTSLEKSDNIEERREIFYNLVKGNEARLKIIEFIVSDFMSYNLLNNLNIILDEYWRDKLKNYKSFLEEVDK